MSERKSLIPEYGPFAGMRIIDTGSLVAMPFAATLLADFGAEVIHIERPGVGDTLRVLAPFANEDGKTVSTSWAQDGRNKLSLSLELNLKHPEVKAIPSSASPGSTTSPPHTLPYSASSQHISTFSRPARAR